MSFLQDPRIGRELAGYRIEALVGRGGMGVVYRAHDLALDRPVALKILSPELAQDERFRERFLIESRLAASIDHPNIIPVYDAGEIAGELYIAMRYVEGADLKQLLLDGPLSEERAVELVAQVAAALDTAHTRGLVHRDVKPSNVLVTEEGHAYLADFGLTRRLGEAGAALGSSQSLGTVDYVAPEQIRSEEIDGRADVYALACLIHECLTGRPPFRRSTDAATLFAHLQEDPPGLSGLDSVLARGLAKSPDDRYPTCGELVGETRRALGLDRRVSHRLPIAVLGLGAVLVGASVLAAVLIRGGGGGQPSTGRLIRINGVTNHVEKTIPVGNAPSTVTVDPTGVWVGNHDDGSVWRVDPERNTTSLKVPAHGKPADIAVSNGDVFVSNGPQDANIALLLPTTGQTDNIVNLATGQSFVGSAHVAAGPSGLWIVTADRHVGRYIHDQGPATTATLPAPQDERADTFASGLAVTPHAVWVIGDPNDPTLWKIDAATGRIVRTLRLPVAPKDVATGGGAVWVTSQLSDALVRVDEATGKVTGTIPVGRGAAGVAFGGGAVWVANAVDRTVSRIDPRTRRVVATIPVEGEPDDIAFGDGSLWVATRAYPDLPPSSEKEVRIGVLAACEGNYGWAFGPSLAGAELALIDRGARPRSADPADGVEGATVAGKRVRLVFGCGDDGSAKALSEARRLVESEGVDILIGPTQLTESFVIRDYARRHPEVTFVNGSAAGQSATLNRPARNFFRFMLAAPQWMAGLGRYAYDDLGWRNVVSVSGTSGFAYSQVAGFIAEFCALGGHIANRIWVPSPTPQDLSPYLAQVPKNVDGFVMTGEDAGATAAFIRHVPMLRHGSLARKVVGGIFLPFSDDAADHRLVGTVYGESTPTYYYTTPPNTNTPPPGRWRTFLNRLVKTFPPIAGAEGTVFPIFYRNGMAAVLEALDEVHGDLSGGEKRFQRALSRVRLDAPNGHISLDGNRQAIGTNYLGRIMRDIKGKTRATTFRAVPGVDQTFGGYFRPGDPLPSRTVPSCVRRTPPRWAR